MKAVEFKARMKNKSIRIPDNLSSELFDNKDVRVILLLEEAENQEGKDFRTLRKINFYQAIPIQTQFMTIIKMEKLLFGENASTSNIFILHLFTSSPLLFIRPLVLSSHRSIVSSLPALTSGDWDPLGEDCYFQVGTSCYYILFTIYFLLLHRVVEDVCR